MSHMADRAPLGSAQGDGHRGAGFFDSFVVDRLRAEGVKQVFVSAEPGLRPPRSAAVRRAYRDGSPDIVIHLAAMVGGIGAN
jgi:GDP-L-fucose synthase